MSEKDKFKFTADEDTRIYRPGEEGYETLDDYKKNNGGLTFTGDLDMKAYRDGQEVPVNLNNPDDRNAEIECEYSVRVYFNTNREHEFPARNLDNARDIAARCVNQHVWIINEDDEEFFPTHAIHKVKIIKK